MYKDQEKNVESNKLPRHLVDCQRTEKKQQGNRSFKQEDVLLEEEKQIINNFITARAKAAQDTCAFFRSIYTKVNIYRNLRKQYAQLKDQCERQQKEQQEEISQLKSKHEDEVKKIIEKINHQKQVHLQKMKERQKNLSASKKRIEQKDQNIKQINKRNEQLKQLIAFHQATLEQYDQMLVKMAHQYSRLQLEQIKWTYCKQIVSKELSRSKDQGKSRQAGQEFLSKFDKKQ